MQEVNPQELYNRQVSMGIYIPQTATIIGLGGGGSWVAISLALMGVKNIKIVDNDFIEESNLNRTLFRYSDINKLKTEAVTSLIKERRPNCLVTSYSETSIKMYNDWQAGLSLNFIELMDTDLIVDATDNYNTRTIFQQLFTSQNGKPPDFIPYCKLGYDGFNFEIDFSFTPIEDSRLRGYRQINTFVGTVMSEVSMLINVIGANQQAKDCIYITTTTKQARDSYRIQEVYKPPPLPVQIDGKMYLPITKNTVIEHDLRGRTFYINIEPDKFDESKSSSYGSSVNKKANLKKCFIIDNSVMIKSDCNSYVFVRNGYRWHIDDLLLLSENTLFEQPKPITEFEESEAEYEILDDC